MIPSLKEFEKLSYEDKQHIINKKVNGLYGFPSEYFLCLPKELKKEFLSKGIGLTEKMYLDVIKDKDLYEHCLKVGDELLTTDKDYYFEINPAKAYYYLGLDLNNYKDIKCRNRFLNVLVLVLNVGKSFHEDIEILFEKKYKPYLFLLDSDEIVRTIELSYGSTYISEKGWVSVRDWIALNIPSEKINSDVIYKVIDRCSVSVLEEKYKIYVNKLSPNQITNLLFDKGLRSDKKNWIDGNIHISETNRDFLTDIIKKCYEGS